MNRYNKLNNNNKKKNTNNNDNNDNNVRFFVKKTWVIWKMEELVIITEIKVIKYEAKKME